MREFWKNYICGSYDLKSPIQFLMMQIMSFEMNFYLIKCSNGTHLWYAAYHMQEIETGILVQISPGVEVSYEIGDRKYHEFQSRHSLCPHTGPSGFGNRLSNSFFPDSRFIVELSWLRTCRTQMILWYWLTVYSDWLSRKEGK